MENNTSDNDPWIDRVLDSVQGIDPLPADPYLYARVMAKMARQNEYVIRPGVVWLTAASFLLMVILNVMAVWKKTSSGKNLGAVVAEYGLGQADAYAPVMNNLDRHE
jgi:hypothetical protein